MIEAFALASTSAQALPQRQVAQNFECQLRTSAGKTIALSGDYHIREYGSPGRGSIQVRVETADKKWHFLNASTRADFRTGPDWFRVMLDLTDPKSNQNSGLGSLDDQVYTLDLNFPAKVSELRGRYGFATLRDQKDDTPLVWESRPYPITAVGPCDITPKKDGGAQ